jgi:hypothetical protein
MEPFRLDSSFAWERTFAVLDVRDWELHRHRLTEKQPLPFRAFNGAWHVLFFGRKGMKVTPRSVAQLTARELMAQEGFGRASLIHVKAWLASYGLTLREGKKTHENNT